MYDSVFVHSLRLFASNILDFSFYVAEGFLNLLNDFTNELPEDLNTGPGDLNIGPGSISGNSTVAMNNTSPMSNSLMNSSSSSNSSNSGTQQVPPSQPQQHNTNSTPQPIQPPSVSSSNTLNQHPGSVSSPQPPLTSISTSGDPTPTMPSVSSTPTHNVASDLNQMTSISMNSFTSMHHQPVPNHALPTGRFNSSSYMGGGGTIGGPHHIINSGPRMSPHMQPHNRIATGPMRVDMPSQPPHGMMQMGGMISSRHMNPGMMGVGHPHGMSQMQMGGGHQYIDQHHPHPHAVGPGGHPGMHSMMGPGGMHHHQSPIGSGVAQPQAMMNMGLPPNAATGHMAPAPPHSHIRSGMNMMIQSSGPRPPTNPMATGKGCIYHFC